MTKRRRPIVSTTISFCSSISFKTLSFTKLSFPTAIFLSFGVGFSATNFSTSLPPTQLSLSGLVEGPVGSLSIYRPQSKTWNLYTQNCRKSILLHLQWTHFYVHHLQEPELLRCKYHFGYLNYPSWWPVYIFPVVVIHNSVKKPHRYQKGRWLLRSQCD